MLCTAVRNKVGMVEDNKMVKSQLNNDKIVERGEKMLMDKTGIKDYEQAKNLWLANGSVKKAAAAYK